MARILLPVGSDPSGRRDGAEERPQAGWRLHRRQLLGGAVLGATGAALGPLVSPAGRSDGPRDGARTDRGATPTVAAGAAAVGLSLIHISEPTRQAEISYAVFCLKKKK